MRFFVSYAKKDTRALALALADALNVPPHHAAWVDRELKATAGTWTRQIEHEIERCDRMIVLLSPDVNRRDDPRGDSFVRKEIEYAINRGKESAIVVVLAQDTSIPLILTGKQYIDFRGQTDGAALADRICDDLGIAGVSVLRRPQPPDSPPPGDIARQHLPGQPAAPQQVPSRRVMFGVFSLIILFGLIAIVALLAGRGASATPTPKPTSLQITFAVGIQTITENDQWTPQERVINGVAMMVVPASCFVIGTDVGKPDEANGSKVCFTTEFLIDKTEVTQAQFRQFGGTAKTAPGFTGDDRPVEQITWLEAHDFCARRGARLPTEAEWEYAARGPEGLDFPWGTWNPNRSVWRRSANQGTANVGSLPDGASWVGALDMSGNVWEWTSSVYKPYPYNARDGREITADTTNERVFRGGSWNVGDGALLRSTTRSRNTPDHSGDTIGFRCVRDSSSD